LLLDAPALLLPEFANILWKKTRKREIEAGQAGDILAALLGAPISIHDMRPVLQEALRIACDQGISAYDVAYLALADYLRCRFVTADAKMYRVLRHTQLETHIQWIESVAVG